MAVLFLQNVLLSKFGTRTRKELIQFCPPPQMLRLKVVCWPSSALLGRTYHQCLDVLTVGYLLGWNNVETFLEKCCRLHWFFK